MGFYVLYSRATSFSSSSEMLVEQQFGENIGLRQYRPLSFMSWIAAAALPLAQISFPQGVNRLGLAKSTSVEN